MTFICRTSWISILIFLFGPLFVGQLMGVHQKMNSCTRPRNKSVLFWKNNADYRETIRSWDTSVSGTTRLLIPGADGCQWDYSKSHFASVMSTPTLTYHLATQVGVMSLRLFSRFRSTDGLHLNEVSTG